MATAHLSAFLSRLTRGMAAETLGDQSDRQLIARLLASREHAAFEAVVRRHGPMVYRVCWRVLRHDQDTEDAFQATFLVLAQKLRTVRKHASLASWLHGVAHRVALKAKAQAAIRRRHDRQASASKVMPPDEVTWGELRSLLDTELARLPEKWRLPLILCYLEGHTQDEAARQLGWSKNTLRRRLDEARAALGRRLTRRGVIWPAALSAALLSDCVVSAALPPGLIGSTVEAAACIAAEQVATTAVVSAHVAALTEGVLKAMFMTKLKIATVVLLALGFIAAGSRLLTSGGLAAQQSDPSHTTKQAANKAEKPAEARKSDQQADKQDTKELEGEWAVVGLEWDGKKVPSFEVRSQPIHFTFKGKEVNSSWFGKGKFAFKLDAARSPKVIDFSPLGGQWQGRKRGIYLLEDGRLRLCLKGPSKDGEPPTEFKTRRGDDGLRVFVLERVVPKGPASRPPAEVAAAEFGAVLREWRNLEESYRAPFQSGTTRQQQQKVRAEKGPKLDAFAGRCLKLAEGQDTPAGLAALCWAVSNAPASEAGKKALAVLKGGRIARAGVEELGDALGLGAAAYLNTNLMSAQIKQELAPLVLGRVKQCLDHPRAAEVLTWVCTCFMDEEPAEAPRTFTEAADLIASRFADSPDINHLCEVLGVIRKPPWARKFEKHLRTILKANHHAHVRLEAEFALASVLQEMEGRQEEARKLYQQFVKDYTGRAQHDGWDDLVKGLVRQAKDELEGMLVRGIGEPAPEIEGDDLDGRPMKLSNFRGKVVLVSFWATWCGPCMKLVPHEESLMKQLKDKPFAIVGVNGDDPPELSQALKKTPVTWRSFKNKRAGKKTIMNEWKILAFPTLYLIDHKGIIRKRWIGAPPTDELDGEIGKLVEEALRGK